MKRFIALLQGPMSDSEFQELVADGIAALIGAVWLILVLFVFGASWLV